MPEKGTEIRIGWTDGYRHIGVRPPLNDAEINWLKEKGALNGGIEQITLDEPCTLIRTSGDFTNPVLHDEATLQAAGALAACLSSIRPASEQITVHPEAVSMSGYQSSPFNPVTR